jgi:hypothetical protein
VLELINGDENRKKKIFDGIFKSIAVFKSDDKENEESNDKKSKEFFKVIKDFDISMLA